MRIEQYGGDPMLSFRDAMLEADQEMLQYHEEYPADHRNAVVICHSVPPSWGEEQRMILMDQNGETFKQCPPKESLYRLVPHFQQCLIAML
jgi:hypothetical protein